MAQIAGVLAAVTTVFTGFCTLLYITLSTQGGAYMQVKNT